MVEGSIILPNGITNIGYMAFYNCRAANQNAIVLPDSITSISSSAFSSAVYHMDNVRWREDGVHYIDHYLIKAKSSAMTPGNYKIREGTIGIAEDAFNGLTSMTSVTIPSSVTSIGGQAFYGCTGLTDVYYAGSKEDWKKISIRYNNQDLTNATIHYAGDSSGIKPENDNNSTKPEYYSATFDARPGKFSASDIAGGYFHEEGGTMMVPRGTDGRYLLKDTPPTPAREGYTFAGWRINFVDGKKDSKLTGQIVKDFTNFNFPADLTFEAEWEKKTSTPNVPAEAPFRIDFDPNGGTITSIRGFPANQIIAGSQAAAENDIFVDKYSGIGMMMTGKNGRLDGFPVVERAGYTLLGWGWSEKNLVSTSTVFSQDTTLTAYWTSGKVYTVTFNLNGKSGTVPPSQKVAAGGKVTLPAAPTASDGSKFICWGYTEDNKTLKEWKADSPVNADLTLYAAWQDSAAPTQAYFGYSFGNNARTFGYPTPYRIPYESFALIYGNTALASQEYESFGEWFGNCYGMCSTSVMFTTGGNNVSVTSFRGGASMPKDLAVRDNNGGWGINLTKFIEAMHISQSAYAPSVEKGGNYNDLNGMCQAVLDAKSAGQGYPLISIYGYTSGDEVSGHTVAGYDLVTVDATTSHLMVYDPNYPNNTERYITLQTNSSGQYVGWYFKYNNSYNWGSGYSGTITYNTYDCYSSVWKEPGSDASVVLLSIDSNNAIVRDKAGNTVATVKNGVISSNQADVYPVILTDSTWSGPTVWLPTGVYTVTNTSSGSKGFEVTMTNVDQSASVTTTAPSVTFLVDDSKTTNSVQISGAGKNYDITLSSTLNQGYKKVSLTGKTAAETTAAAQISGKLYGTNLDAAGTVKADGKDTGSGILSGEVPDGSGIPGQPSQPSGSNPFTDVPSNAYYYDAVLWAVKQGITSGTSATTFSPNASCTRAQTVTFLWRAAGSPAPKDGTNPFMDVRSDSYYYDAVLWAVEQGITSGTSATTFSPDAAVTRAQTVTFLYRAAGSPPTLVTSSFLDVDENAWYAGPVQWAVAQEITNGTSASTFAPDAGCTRAQIVTFLYRDMA